MSSGESSAALAGAELDVDSADVIRLMLQYCKENGLAASFRTLQAESGVSFSAIDSMERFGAAVRAGSWDLVLKQLEGLALAPRLLADLYEQIVLELLELRDVVSAQALLATAPPLQALTHSHPERVRRLEALAAAPSFDPAEGYGPGTTKKERRAALLSRFEREVFVAPPSRLLALLGQALKHQAAAGLAPAGGRLDLFRGQAPELGEESTVPAAALETTIRFGTKSYPESALFSSDGSYLVTGSVDGLIEVWDYFAGRLRMDLPYQAAEECMMVDGPVLALALSRDSGLLASGDSSGSVLVWNTKTGRVLRSFDRVHSKGVTALLFVSDGSQIASGSFDASLRLFGLRSGKQLKDFRGHTSFINGLVWSADESKLVSVSSDGTLKVWSTSSAETLMTWRPPNAGLGHELALLRVIPVPGLLNHLLVVPRAGHLYVISLDGSLIKTFSPPPPPGLSDNGPSPEGGPLVFLDAAISFHSEWIYGLGSDRRLYTWAADSASPLGAPLELHRRPAVGLVSHPRRNLIASYSEDGTLKLWGPPSAGE